MKGAQLFYAVVKTETDRDCTVIRTETDVRFLGGFETIEKAQTAINEDLKEKRFAVENHYAGMAAPVEKELSETIHEIATEKDPEIVAMLKNVAETLSARLTHYRESTPEYLVEHDADGNLCEVSARDESLGWLCCYDIIPSEIQ